MWNPGKWRWNERLLAAGVSIGLLADVAGVAYEVGQWDLIGSVNWFLIGAAVIKSASLLWYVWDSATTGDFPLNPVRVRHIRQVSMGMMMEDEGAEVDWESIDGNGVLVVRWEKEGAEAEG